MANVPRWYQDEDADLVCNALDNGMNRVCIADATGLGKSTIEAIVVKRRTDQGRTVLVNVDRKELVRDMFRTIMDFCGFNTKFGQIDIAIEMAEEWAPAGCKVVVASIQSLTGDRLVSLLQRFHFDDILTDECDRAAAETNLKLYDMAGVNEGKCTHSGYSATPERGDDKLLYARDENNKPVTVLKGRSKTPHEAKPEDCIYEQLLVRRDFGWGVDNGYLVDGVFWGFQTETSLEGLPINAKGEYDEDEYAKRVDNAKRTLVLVNAHKQLCPERQCIAFCASVEHAQHSAELWRGAGFNAHSVDAKTPDKERDKIFADFKSGRSDVLTNFSVIEKGMDFPSASCVAFLRQSLKSKFVTQGMGRVLRVLPGIVDTPELRPREMIEGRIAAIAASKKKDAYILDAVDAHSVNVKRPQEIVGLPSNMLMQGERLTKVKKKIQEFCEKTGRNITECPLDFSEVEVILHRTIQYQAIKINQNLWPVSDVGHTFAAAMPGYSAHILCKDSSNELVIKHGDNVISNWPIPPDKSLAGAEGKDILQKAANYTFKKIREHNEEYRKENPIKRDLGTWERLSDGQRNVLLYGGKMNKEAINNLTYGYAKILIGNLMKARNKVSK